MEFVDRIFGIEKRRQKRFLTEMGIKGELKKEPVGPEFEKALVVMVDNDLFLKILRSGEQEKVLSHLINQSDTHQYHELYVDIGEGIKAKTGVASTDYSHQETLFSDLDKMSYKPKESKDKWSVYEIGRS